MASPVVRLKPAYFVWLVASAPLTFAAAAFVGCASTEFFPEGPGQPTDLASGNVPTGMLGVCRRPFTQRPPIVNPTLWEHARTCVASTPSTFIRLGYGQERGNPAEATRKVDKMMEALREGPKQEAGNTKVLTMLRQIRSEGESDPWLRDRIFKQSARTAVCDFTYLLNTMGSESKDLKQGDKCAAHAYDQRDRKEVCLFDTGVSEAVWLTSAWACVTRTGEIGNAESCHRLCSYDDYCARQVSCVAPDLDLALCALGVCLPSSNEIVL